MIRHVRSITLYCRRSVDSTLIVKSLKWSSLMLVVRPFVGSWDSRAMTGILHEASALPCVNVIILSSSCLSLLNHITLLIPTPLTLSPHVMILPQSIRRTRTSTATRFSHDHKLLICSSSTGLMRRKGSDQFR